MNWKILLVDDDKNSVQPLLDEIMDAFSGYEPKVYGFQEAKEKFSDFAPQVLILDIFQGRAFHEGNAAGKPIYNELLEGHFCPVIIYSAFPEEMDQEQGLDNPFVQRVKKGSGSEKEVIDHLRSFAPHVEALQEFRDDIAQRVASALKVVAPFAFQSSPDQEMRKQYLVRASKRYVAAYIDQPSSDSGGSLAPWEHYICPALGNTPLTGDILHKRKDEERAPNTFRVALTPSCDLVVDGDRKAKVDKVLAAKCEDITVFLKDIGLSPGTKEATIRDKIPRFLTQGYCQSCVPLPALPGVFPQMTIQLKSLELIPFESIGTDNQCEYERVASVDSPFREMITWAYLQICGRPGLPDRDCTSWSTDIAKEATKVWEGARTP